MPLGRCELPRRRILVGGRIRFVDREEGIGRGWRVVRGGGRWGRSGGG